MPASSPSIVFILPTCASLLLVGRGEYCHDVKEYLKLCCKWQTYAPELNISLGAMQQAVDRIAAWPILTPVQRGGSNDCGVFVLEYISRFITGNVMVSPIPGCLDKTKWFDLECIVKRRFDMLQFIQQMRRLTLDERQQKGFAIFEQIEQIRLSNA